jgi:IS30 family transposase
MSHTQLTQPQRYVIYILNKRGVTQTTIADEIDVNKSMVSREL